MKLVFPVTEVNLAKVTLGQYERQGRVHSLARLHLDRGFLYGIPYQLELEGRMVYSKDLDRECPINFRMDLSTVWCSLVEEVLSDLTSIELEVDSTAQPEMVNGVMELRVFPKSMVLRKENLVIGSIREKEFLPPKKKRRGKNRKDYR